MNDWQKSRFAARIVRSLFNTVARKRIAIWGFAFKKDTNDTRESAAITICRDLLEEHAEVVVYDPKVPAEQIIAEVLGKGCSNSRLHIAHSAEEAAAGAHAIAVITEWDEFKSVDFKTVFENMPKPAFVFDGRNILDLPKLREIGFSAVGIGK
jgi:UDPglucose 6-dehydrogenase